MASQPELVTDPILALMPGIGLAEYKERKRLRAALDIALKMVADAPDGPERVLWMGLRDHCGVWLYTSAPLKFITQAADVAESIWRAAHDTFKLAESMPDGR